MTKKLNFFHKKSVAEKIHSYFIQLQETEFDDSAKAPSIGYKRRNQKYKFATLHGGNSYQLLVLHVDPGNLRTTLGKEKQKEIQQVLSFDIGTIRNHTLKPHEVYIPLEKIDSINPLESIKDLINYAYHKQGN